MEKTIARMGPVMDVAVGLIPGASGLSGVLALLPVAMVRKQGPGLVVVITVMVLVWRAKLARRRSVVRVLLLILTAVQKTHPVERGRVTVMVIHNVRDL